MGDGLVELKEATLEQDHGTHRRDGLRHRVEAHDSVEGEWELPLNIGKATRMHVSELAVAGNHGNHARYLSGSHPTIRPICDGAEPARTEAHILRMSCWEWHLAAFVLNVLNGTKRSASLHTIPIHDQSRGRAQSSKDGSACAHHGRVH